MMTLDEVNELAGTMVANGVTSLEIKGQNYAVRLVRAPRAGAATGTTHSPVAKTAEAVSPATGPFLHRGDHDGLPVLERNTQILAGEPLGYVGKGPVRLLCVSPASGRLVGAFPSQGQSVSAGDFLFTVDVAT